MRLSLPVSRVNCSAGIKASKNPLRAQCEQLHSITFSMSALRVNVTAPQWQLPECVFILKILTQLLFIWTTANTTGGTIHHIENGDENTELNECRVGKSM